MAVGADEQRAGDAAVATAAAVQDAQAGGSVSAVSRYATRCNALLMCECAGLVAHVEGSRTDARALSLTEKTSNAHALHACALCAVLCAFFSSDAAGDSQKARGLALDAELLNEVFRFKYKPPSSVQEESVSERLARHFTAFVDTRKPVTSVASHAFSARDPLASDRDVPIHQHTKEEYRKLQRVCEILNPRRQQPNRERVRGNVWIESWFPKYGCALQMEVISVSSIALKLVFLDGWTHVKHFPPGQDCIHSAVPKHFSALNCGSIRPDLKQKLLDELQLQIEKAKLRTGVARSAGFNELGHQKTPQFIAALVRIAKTSLAASGSGKDSSKSVVTQRVIKGGTTDVGMHTGGQSRDTCWPLVQAVVQQHLLGSGALYEKTMIQFKLCLVLEKTAAMESMAAAGDFSADAASATSFLRFWEVAEDAFCMLQTTVLEIVALVERGYDASAIEVTCAVARQRINDAVSRMNDRTRARYTLPPSDVIDEIKRTIKLPQLLSKLEHRGVINLHSEIGYDMQKHARQQLGFFELVDPLTCTATSLIKWLTLVDGVSGHKQLALVVLRTIETFVFSKSAWLQTPDQSAKQKFNPKKFKDIVEVYDSRIKEWDKEPLSSSLMEVEQRSRHLLVKWLTFCLAHQAYLKKHELLTNYGIALSWQSLDVAVLREEAAIDALSHVVAYIRSWNKRGYDPLFDLSNPIPTAHFARSFAANSKIYVTRYIDEVERLEQRVTNQWDMVCEKKATADSLKVEIKQLDASLQRIHKLLNAEQDRLLAQSKHLPHNMQQCHSPATAQHTTHINDLTNWRHNQVSVLEQTLLIPSFIVNPLPKDRMSALEKLFFLDIPVDIAMLWEFCLNAQRALVPSKLSREEARSLRDDVPNTTWLDFYSSYSLIKYPSDVRLTGYMPVVSIPDSHGPWTVDELTSREDYASRCVWYPPGGDTRVHWEESSRSMMNPFQVSRKMTLDYFTHELPSEFENLEWAIAYPGGEQRGNLVYSKFSEQ